MSYTTRVTRLITRLADAKKLVSKKKLVDIKKPIGIKELIVICHNY